jgi:hypothetical protein
VNAVAEMGHSCPFSPQNYTLCHSSERNLGGQGGLSDFFNRDKDLSAVLELQRSMLEFTKNHRDSDETQSDFSYF